MSEQNEGTECAKEPGPQYTTHCSPEINLAKSDANSFWTKRGLSNPPSFANTGTSISRTHTRSSRVADGTDCQELMESRSFCLHSVGWNLELPFYSNGTMVQLNHKYSRKNMDNQRIHNSTLRTKTSMYMHTTFFPMALPWL